MPVILAPQNYEPWLDPEVHDPEKVMPLLKSYPEEEMEFIRWVSASTARSTTGRG